MKELTGVRFGRLIAVAPTNQRSTNNAAIWQCLCDCGSLILVPSGNLLRGNTKSCGCLAWKKELRGLRFGSLVVIEPIEKRNRGRVMWRCLCDCGCLCIVASSRLINGDTKSCGCLKHRKGPDNPCWDSTITNEEREQARKHPAYKEWRLGVYARDGFICQRCGQDRAQLRAHHIESYSDNPELRTALINGITLCSKCHKDFHHVYGYKANTKKQLEEWL